MKIVIRCDASTSIGTGHVKRMLSVAHALKARGAEIVFVHRALDLDVSATLEANGHRVATLPAPTAPLAQSADIPHAGWAEVSQAQDAMETLGALSGEAIDALIVDHYAFGADWHRAVGEGLGVPVMVIDDLADRPLWGNWLVDHNYHPDHAAKYSGLVSREMTILAGPRFAMLGPTYADAPRYMFNEDVGSIGVFMGGVDLVEANIKVLAALDEARWTGPVEVVSTSANPGLEKLRNIVSQRANTSLTVDLPDLADFFARHDLQIGAGGGAIWERCCIGPPTVCLVCAENQRLSVPFLDAAGIVAGYDVLADAPRQELSLAQTIASVISNAAERRAMNAAATALVDGAGAARIADALMGRAQEASWVAD